MSTHVARLPSRPRSTLVTLGLALVPAAAAMAQDADFMAVLKLQNFEQSSPHIVALFEEDFNDPDDAPFLFEAFVDVSAPNLLTSGLVSRPSGPDVSMLTTGGGEELLYEEGFELISEMNDAFGDGFYTFHLVGVNDGAVSVDPLNFSGESYPGLTRFTVFTAAQNIDASADFTFQWDPIPGGALDDVVFLCIEDDFGSIVFESPETGEPGSLNGLSTSALVPAGTLAAGTDYEVLLEVFRPIASNETYAPGVLALCGYGKSIVMRIRTAGGTDAVAPDLVRSVPSSFAPGVEANTIVTFIFDEAMDTGVNVSQAINWTGLSNPALFSYLWSPDGRILFCNYTPGLPLSTTVGWTLNAAGSAAKLRDGAGNNLPDDLAGQFETANTSNLGVPDVQSVELIKGRAFCQEGATAEDLESYFGEFFVELNGTSTVTSVDFGIPGGGLVLNAGRFGFNNDEIFGEAAYAAKADLDRILPDGSYPFTLHTVHDGEKVVTLTMGPAAYPNAPTIRNFAATQAWDSTQPLTLEWDPMAGGTASDLIVLLLEGNNTCFFESPNVGEAGALDGTVTSLVIPGNTLPPGRSLFGELIFARITTNDTTQYPGVRGVAAIASITEFEVQTTGDPIRPRLEVKHDGGLATVTIMGEKGRQYELRRSEDLQNWSRFTNFGLFSDHPGFEGSFDVFDNVFGIPKRFYQVEDVTGTP